MNGNSLKHRTNPAAHKAAQINGMKEETMNRAKIVTLLLSAMVALVACGDTNGPGDTDGECTTAACRDNDDDGVTVGGGDCNDGNRNVHPGVAEVCNGIDDNCVNGTDEGCSSDAGTPDGGTDQDGDGFERCGTPATAGCDCDDSDPTVHPGATDVCDNATDEDCSGSDCHDGGSSCEADCGDSFACTSDFCDGNRCVHVPHNDRCGDGQLCDMGRGCVDTTPTACADGCSDGIACTEDACEGGRCVHRTDDTVCGADARCDVRDGCVGRGSVCRDADCSDGILCTIDACDGPVCAHIPDDSRCGSGMRCDDGSGCVDAGECRNAGDCDDGVSCTNDSCVAGSCRHTRDDGACRDGELCDLDWDCIPEPECTRDDDCRDTVSCTDNFCSFGFCVTDPRDTFCPSGQACDRFLGCVSTCTPVAEACDNGRDDDCDGQVDEGCGVSCTPRIWYRDSDTDTFGDPNVTVTQCTQPAGYVDHDTDCNDGNAAQNPGRTEVCGNGVDDDCSGSDATCAPGCTATTWYRDSDGDTYGDATQTQSACTQPSGYVNRGGDCLDTNASVHPGATENTVTQCGDGIDQDCVGGDFACGAEICTNGVDDDHDAWVDCADPNCMGTSWCGSGGTSEICNNGIDDGDTDTLIDCADPECSGTSFCSSTCRPNESGYCGNGLDDDCDGRIDSADSDCGGTSGCTTSVRVRYHSTYSGTLSYWLERTPGTSLASGTFTGTLDQTFANVCPSSRWNGDNGTTAGNRFFCNYWAGAASSPWGDSYVEYWVGSESTSRRAYCQSDSAIPGGGGNFILTF